MRTYLTPYAIKSPDHRSDAHGEHIHRQPWQSVKAVAKRNAKNLNDDHPHRPVAALHDVLRQEIAKFLDSPLGWPGYAPSGDEKQLVINLIKAELAMLLVDRR